MPTRLDIRNQMAGDYAVHKKLEAAGDDSQTLHTISYHFLSDAENLLIEMSKVAMMLGFEITPIQPTAPSMGNTQFSCYLRTKGMTLLMFLGRQSIMMLALAEAYGCSYEGWSTEIVKK